MFTDSTQLDEISLPFSQRRKLCEKGIFVDRQALIFFLCEICFGRVAQFISVRTADRIPADICGFIAALTLIPASYAARGYFAFGGEWLIVLGVTLLAFHVINNAFFGMLKHH